MLFPAIQPDNTWYFPVSNTHTLYIEESGNPEGIPVVFLHGGPGGNCHSPRYKAVWGFFAAYFAIAALMILLLMASGLDQDTSFSAVVACLNNLGPGLGEVGQNYASINDFAKWVLVLAMLLGRLEIFTLLVLFTPAFWRK